MDFLNAITPVTSKLNLKKINDYLLFKIDYILHIDQDISTSNSCPAAPVKSTSTAFLHDFRKQILGFLLFAKYAGILFGKFKCLV